MKNTNGNKFLTTLLFLAAWLGGIFILIVQRPTPDVQTEFVVNEPAPRTVFSPVYVSYVDEEETARLRQAKQAQLLRLFTLDPKVMRGMSEEVNQFFKSLAEAVEKQNLAEFQFNWPLSLATRDYLLKPEALEQVPKTITLAFERFLNQGILKDEIKNELVTGGSPMIQVRDPDTGAETQRDVNTLFSVSEAREKVTPFLEKEGVKDKELRGAVQEILSNVVRPNLFFDETETKNRLKQTADSVPPVPREVKRGELIAQKGLLMTARQLERLVQVQKKMSKKQVESRSLTAALFVFLALGLTGLFLRQFERRESRSLHFPGLVLALLGTALAAEKIIYLIPGSSFYLIPAAVASILMTILWSPTLGILGSLAMTLLSAPLVEFRVDMILMTLTGSLAGVFAARGIRKRVQFFMLGLTVGLVNALTLIGCSFFQEWQPGAAFHLAPLGIANGFFATTLAFFLVPFFETLFNLTTDITLLELSDLNHPLLKRMVVEAPGTYHHSLVMSTLAERACEAIGANALLARVGCYFHDIGKIARSEYFTENQNAQGENKHEKLTPTMSSLVVMNHVKEGVELARKYKLKEVIVRFIPEHHGKGVIYYFYRKALDQAAPGEKVNPDDFRYPGPKPQSRETAVGMLADSVEAASRSLKEFNPAAILTLVRKIINDKFIDGQLDECDLTLKDLHKIQESFVQNLMAIYHTRVSYPKAEHPPSRPDLFEPKPFSEYR